jgi:tetratricopeptide (TPR) repeat protein
MVLWARCRHLSRGVLLGCLIGLAACWGCGSKAVPGRDDFDEGCKFLAGDKLPEAVAAFDRAIAANPNDALAILYRGDAKWRQKQPSLAAKAIEDYTKAIALDDTIAKKTAEQKGPYDVRLGEEAADAYCHRGLSRCDVQQNDGAIDDFTEALKRNPKNADAYRGLAAAFLAKGLALPAIDDLAEAIRLAPESSETFCLRGQAWLALDEYDKAGDDARSAIRLDTKNGDAFYVLGLSLLARPKPQIDKAKEYFGEAVRRNKELESKSNSKLAEAYFNHGVSLDKDGKRLEVGQFFGEAAKASAKAEEAFGKAIQLRQEYADRYRKYREEVDREKQHPGDHMVVEPIKDNPRVWPAYSRAKHMLERKRLDRALASLSDLIETGDGSKYAEVWYLRGIAFLEKGFPDSAIPDFDQAIRLAPNPVLADSYCRRGQACCMMGDFTRAIRDTTLAIGLKSTLPQAYFHRADAYLQADQPERALANLDEAVRLARMDAKVAPEVLDQARSLHFKIYRRLGINALATRHWNTAIDSLTRAIRLQESEPAELGPQLALAYREQGFKEAKQGKFEEADRKLMKAFDLDKNNAENHRLYGLTRCQMAEACHNRKAIAEEKAQWEIAIKQLKLAIWLEPKLEYQLRRPLADAQRRLDAFPGLVNTKENRQLASP